MGIMNLLETLRIEREAATAAAAAAGSSPSAAIDAAEVDSEQ